MNGYFGISKARQNCDHIPRLGEVCQYQYDSNNNLWDTRIGDGKTPVKDLPRLANYDIYERVAKLEIEVANLKREYYE